jgi:hypothetical protein
MEIRPANRSCPGCGSRTTPRRKSSTSSRPIPLFRRYSRASSSSAALYLFVASAIESVNDLESGITVLALLSHYQLHCSTLRPTGEAMEQTFLQIERARGSRFFVNGAANRLLTHSGSITHVIVVKQRLQLVRLGVGSFRACLRAPHSRSPTNPRTSGKFSCGLCCLARRRRRSRGLG